MKQPKSGETIEKGTIEGFENLTPGEGVEGYEYASELSTDGAQIIDPGYGKTVTIRDFHFSMNPAVKELPDQQSLFNAHAKQISTILWADGLIPVDSVAPRVIINKKKHLYHIFVTCEARMNQVFIDKPKNLSEHLHATRHH